MMYSNKLAVALKSNGKVLREFKDTVYVPFGTEYSILIKNLNSVRAQVRISVDGSDATEGVCLVLQPNSELELERFIKNGNMNAGNRFKFIERTAGIEKHRGVQLEDGLIRIEYQFEQQYTYTFPYYSDPYYKGSPTWVSGGVLTNANNISGSLTKSAGGSLGGALRGMTASASAGVALNASEAYATTQSVNHVEAPVNDAGITVEGSVSEQKFSTAAWFAVESVKHVMVLKILGETEGKAVVKPVTVKAKPVCKTCGKHNKATSKFCAECGTSLEIVK